jgi:SAM-dependent methyltransferase
MPLRRHLTPRRLPGAPVHMDIVTMSGFDAAYRRIPPWDIGRPQREIVRLEEEGGLHGSILDCGCGTGENALYLANRGHEVWGVDSSPNAIRKAQSKASERAIAAKLLVVDALDLGGLGQTFDTVIDCGLFHVFSDADRERYVSSLATVTAPGAKLFLLCFSDLEPGDIGPRRVRREEIRQAFVKGWRVQDIRASTLERNIEGEPAKAWLSEIVRIALTRT